MALKPHEERAMMFEGFKAEPYLDTMGYPTIGIGEKLENIRYSKEQGVPSHLKDKRRTMEESVQNLQRHFANIEQDVSNRFGKEWGDVPDDIKGVVLDMAYNIGASGLFDGFKGFIGDVKSKDYKNAALNLKYKDPSIGDNPDNYSDWWNQVGGSKTETNVNTGEWGKESRASNRATANFDILSNYKDPESKMVDNVVTEQGSSAFTY